MTDRRTRGPDGTLQTQVWRLLHDVASMTAGELSAAVGHEREACRRACQYLARRGRVARHRVGRWVVYAALGRKAPQDLRGKPPGCRNHRGQVAYAKWVRMMVARLGPTWVPPPRGCALAEAWRPQG